MKNYLLEKKGLNWDFKSEVELEYQGILETRNQLLTFDSRIKESINGSAINYAFKKNKEVAEIRYDNRRKQPVLFLWLPLTNINCHTIRARMKVWTDWLTVSDVGYIRKGNGNMISISEYKSFPIELIPAKILPFTKYTGIRKINKVPVKVGWAKQQINSNERIQKNILPTKT